MSSLAATARELFGLFVDDGMLAVAILALVLAATIVAALVPGGPLAAALALALGCPAVLLANIMAALRARRAKAG